MALEQHLNERALRTTTPVDRLRKEVALQRLLARMKASSLADTQRNDSSTICSTVHRKSSPNSWRLKDRLTRRSLKIGPCLLVPNHMCTFYVPRSSLFNQAPCLFPARELSVIRPSRRSFADELDLESDMARHRPVTKASTVRIQSKRKSGRTASVECVLNALLRLRRKEQCLRRQRSSIQVARLPIAHLPVECCKYPTRPQIKSRSRTAPR